MTIAVYLILVGIGLTIFLLFLMIRSGSSKAKKIVKTEEESLQAIVHELRAPLVAVKDGASLMLSQNLEAKEQKDMLNMIHDQSKKMLDQISKILDTARVNDGKLALHKTPGDLGKVISDEIALFMPEAKRKKISLTAETEPLPPFLFDQIRVTEALNNLISNGLKYTNEGGKVDIRVKKSNEMAEISVTDNGIGIATEKQKMLFTKFSSINENINPVGLKLSSGLGLYITKGIIEAHGGTISVTSQEGKGTTMTFTLPIEKAAPVN